MSSQSAGRRRSNMRQYSAEDQALNMISKEAESRLAAKRAARAEAREIRLKEMERQQKESEKQDRQQSNDQTTGKSRHLAGSRSSSRRGSIESNESESKDIDFKMELRELEDKYKSAMMTSAQLDNEKQSLVYQVELLKDQLEEQDEGYTELQRQFKDKCRDFDFQKRDLQSVQHELSILKQQLEIKDRLIEDSGFVIIANDKGEPTLAKQASSSSSNGPLPCGAALVSQETKEFLEKADGGTLGTSISCDIVKTNPVKLDVVGNNTLFSEEISKSSSVSACHSEDKFNGLQCNPISDDLLKPGNDLLPTVISTDVEGLTDAMHDQNRNVVSSTNVTLTNEHEVVVVNTKLTRQSVESDEEFFDVGDGLAQNDAQIFCDRLVEIGGVTEDDFNDESNDDATKCAQDEQEIDGEKDCQRTTSKDVSVNETWDDANVSEETESRDNNLFKAEDLSEKEAVSYEKSLTHPQVEGEHLCLEVQSQTNSSDGTVLSEDKSVIHQDQQDEAENLGLEAQDETNLSDGAVLSEDKSLTHQEQQDEAGNLCMETQGETVLSDGAFLSEDKSLTHQQDEAEDLCLEAQGETNLSYGAVLSEDKSLTHQEQQDEAENLCMETHGETVLSDGAFLSEDKSLAHEELQDEAENLCLEAQGETNLSGKAVLSEDMSLTHHEIHREDDLVGRVDSSILDNANVKSEISSGPTYFESCNTEDIIVRTAESRKDDEESLHSDQQEEVFDDSTYGFSDIDDALDDGGASAAVENVSQNEEQGCGEDTQHETPQEINTATKLKRGKAKKSKIKDDSKKKGLDSNKDELKKVKTKKGEKGLDELVATVASDAKTPTKSTGKVKAEAKESRKKNKSAKENKEAKAAEEGSVDEFKLTEEKGLDELVATVASNEKTPTKSTGKVKTEAKESRKKNKSSKENKETKAVEEGSVDEFKLTGDEPTQETKISPELEIGMNRAESKESIGPEDLEGHLDKAMSQATGTSSSHKKSNRLSFFKKVFK